MTLPNLSSINLALLALDFFAIIVILVLKSKNDRLLSRQSNNEWLISDLKGEVRQFERELKIANKTISKLQRDMKASLKFDPVIEEAAEELSQWIKEEERAS